MAIILPKDISHHIEKFHVEMLPGFEDRHITLKIKLKWLTRKQLTKIEEAINEVLQDSPTDRDDGKVDQEGAQD